MEMELLKLKGRDYWLLVLGFRLSSSILTHSARQLQTGEQLNHVVDAWTS
jgi:hypothetical protein